MLVLTRKLGEKIRIGDNISVSIVELDGRHVKIGIDAPRNVTVHREEVYIRIEEENKNAAESKQANIQEIAKLFQGKKDPS